MTARLTALCVLSGCRYLLLPCSTLLPVLASYLYPVALILQILLATRNDVVA
jgi:hypothetical protein